MTARVGLHLAAIRRLGDIGLKRPNFALTPGKQLDLLASLNFQERGPKPASRLFEGFAAEWLRR